MYSALSVGTVLAQYPYLQSHLFVYGLYSASPILPRTACSLSIGGAVSWRICSLVCLLPTSLLWSSVLLVSMLVLGYPFLFVGCPFRCLFVSFLSFSLEVSILSPVSLSCSPFFSCVNFSSSNSSVSGIYSSVFV